MPVLNPPEDFRPVPTATVGIRGVSLGYTHTYPRSTTVSLLVN